MRPLPTALFLGWLSALALAAETPGPERTPTPEPYAPIRYEDGQVSENDRCAVSQKRLNTKIPPVYVNGRVIGFC